MQGNMHVRYLDWAEAIAMEGAQTAQNTDSSNAAAAANQAAADNGCQQQAKTIAPHVQSDETFNVIIGTDIVYEVNATPCILSLMTHPTPEYGKIGWYAVSSRNACHVPNS